MVCPNCVSPYKCNGPHVFALSDKVYKCEYGYFILKDEWVFVPIETEFSSDTLFTITNTLRNLNETSLEINNE
jgi:hypothetical protein